MKLLLISLFGTHETALPRGVKMDYYQGDDGLGGYDASAEVYRVHFYQRSNSDNNEYILYKRVSETQTQQINVHQIPDPTYYMTRVAHDLARWQGYTSVGAQQRFIESDFDLEYSTLWQYGCYGQLRPYRHGRGDPVDVFDNIYKEYQTCLACIKHDYDEKRLNEYSFCYDLKEYQFICPKDPSRNTEAQWAQCECDAKLANKLSKVRADEQNFMFNNEVIYEDQCFKSSPKERKSTQPQCCGTYPHRFVFHTDGGRQCCGDKLFNSSTQQCCSRSILGLEEQCPNPNP